ncbi:MAG: DNA repair protein RecO [Thiotrichales bacterium]|jgi:DNA repair protein RecO (recombination protein O)|nr:DNA repair protein RecO [Thiotrichales bacterium]MDP6163622.1 DNA repair protein RecO [Candidatus Thioglobus sp.]|tara:strand:+ start:1110 stop:1796 length:687 start_codon:yes stop_codon:yes gene_type:complete
MTRVENSPAFLIHRRMYQGSSLLLDFFTKDYGKLRLIARGARSSKTSLQMFQCLSISFKGKGDLKSLSQWEISDEPRRLMGNDLVMAIYVNELIQRLLPEGEEHSEIFKSYWSYIKNINTLDSVAKEYSLRVFENQLLQDLGYGLDFDDDINGNIINNNLQYDYIEDQGFTVNDEGVISGSMLLHLSNSNESITNPNELSILKKMNRKRLKSLLGDKPLKSKELFFVD